MSKSAESVNRTFASVDKTTDQRPMKSLLIAALLGATLAAPATAFAAFPNRVDFTTRKGQPISVPIGDPVGMKLKTKNGTLRFATQRTEILSQQGDSLTVATYRHDRRLHYDVADTLTVNKHDVRVVKLPRPRSSSYSGSGSDYGELWQMALYILCPPYFIIKEVSEACARLGESVSAVFSSERYRYRLARNTN